MSLVACTETTRQYRDLHINYDSLAASIPKSDTLTIINKEMSDTNSEFKYYIVCNYPELIHFDKEIIQKKVNYSIENKLSEIISFFRMEQETMFSDTTGMNLPEDFDEYESRTSFLTIDYEIVSKDRDIMSIIFGIQQYYPFAMHPIHYHKTMNFDMNTGEEITLSNFFSIWDTEVIDRISKFSFNKIMEMNISDSVWVSNGLLPEWDNFKNYNITRNDLIFTFDVYQVASYAQGPVRVTIPWDSIIIQIPDSIYNDEGVIVE